MKTIARVTYSVSVISLLAALAGCAVPTPAAEPQPPTQAALEQLQQVRDKYLAGKYGDVIRSVATSNELAAAPASVRVEALKLQAFSYCVSNYRELCEDGFLRILQIDPSFELAPGEQGHPQWGPAFRSAKTAMTPAR
jgi:hypothetical protein